jgi:hypothetical protein
MRRLARKSLRAQQACINEMVTGPMMLMVSVMGTGSETCFEYDEERHRPQSRGDQHLILLLDSLDKLTYLNSM